MTIFNFQFSIFKTNRNNAGFSLIETLVVVGLFAFIGIVVSQSTAITLSGSRKAEAATKVRENLDQALDVVERQLRSAKSISSCSATNIQFVDENGANQTIACQNTGTGCTTSTQSYVYLGTTSFRLTSTEALCVTHCQFTCTAPSLGVPPSVDIVLEGQSKNATGVEDTFIRTQTSVNLRAY